MKMNSRRSRDAPMDWQYTNRPDTKPVWAVHTEPATPKKRSHDDLHATAPKGNPPPMFGTNQNVPFLFNQAPVPTTPHAYPWNPPPAPSHEKASHELNDVVMTDASPPKPEDSGKRPVATGALRRVYRARQRAKSRARSVAFDDEEGSEGSEDEDAIAVTKNTSNHYTLNMPSPSHPKPDLPYILSGYLQFFFNLSLIVLFLYLVLQFILTVQRDVEHRISEYSMDIVQEIAMCAAEFKKNQCQNPLPGLAHQCANWETCMNRDPTIVGRAKVGAELIAEVVNGFVEPISWKTLVFTLTSLSFLTVFINTLLSLYRSRHHPSVSVAHQQPPSLGIPSGSFIPHQLDYVNWSRSSEPPVDGAPPRRRRLEGGSIEKVN